MKLSINKCASNLKLVNKYFGIRDVLFGGPTALLFGIGFMILVVGCTDSRKVNFIYSDYRAQNVEALLNKFGKSEFIVISEEADVRLVERDTGTYSTIESYIRNGDVAVFILNQKPINSFKLGSVVIIETTKQEQAGVGLAVIPKRWSELSIKLAGVR